MLEQFLGWDKGDFNSQRMCEYLSQISELQRQQSDDRCWQPLNPLPALEPLPADIAEQLYLMDLLETEEEEEEDPSVIAYSEEWENYYEKQDYESALKWAEQLVEIRGQAKDWLRQAYCLEYLKRYERYEEALTCYNKALVLDPTNTWEWVSQGDVLMNLQRYEEALICYNKALALVPNFALAWTIRGYVLDKLKRYEEAVESYDKAVAWNSDYKGVWGIRGYVLINLKEYDEALVSCDRAIAIGEQYFYVFFIRAIALLALNHWVESMTTLDNALGRLTDGQEPDTEEAKLTIAILFNCTQDATIWKSRLTILIELYDKHKFIATLGQGIIQSIPALMSEMVSDKAAETWLQVWQELAGNVSELVIPLRLLNAAVRYKITKGDRRVLLEIPIEERNLLQPLLETDTSGY